MLTLAAKLTFLLRRRRGPDGEPPSNLVLSRQIRALPDFKRGGSPGQLSNLRRGVDDNPTVATIGALAAVLDAPSAFLLPGWDDIDALTLVGHHPGVREVVRHLDGLPPEELLEVLVHVRKRRIAAGLDPNCPRTAIPEDIDSGDTDRRHRRRRTPEEQAEYAANVLEGRPQS
ncbi:hypothetical protein AB0C52_31910 [Streptomyces sp. NPDC048717]|uniref:hypothetical protein n=1 Tax=Streptomyces sp. NPDC048717 TaxID=3154928 RepID=UPI0034173ADC